MHHYAGVEGGTPIGNYWLPVVTGGGEAEPQKGGEIARAWIADPKVYLDIPVSHCW